MQYCPNKYAYWNPMSADDARGHRLEGDSARGIVRAGKRFGRVDSRHTANQSEQKNIPSNHAERTRSGQSSSMGEATGSR
jgi:hypothetical protein